MAFSILNLFLVLFVAWLAGRLASRLGYPSVLGELLAGIVLGPPLLGLLAGSEALSVLAEIGILLMMLYIGMEIDPGELRKASKAGLLAAFGGFITPFVLCYFVVTWAGGSTMAAVFVGVAAGVTSLATKSRILVDLKLLDTRIAHVMMAGALIADTLSLVIFAGVLGVAELGGLDLRELAVVAVKAIGFFAIAAVVGLKVFPPLGKWLRTSSDLGRTGRFTLILLVMLLFAEGAELAGMHGILGAFIAGLFLRGPVLGQSGAREMMHLVRDASLGFLAPIFFVTAGFAVSLDVFTTDLALLAGVIGLATVGKIVGTALFYLPTGHGWREGLTVGAGMNGRGAVEIIVAQIGLSMGLISQEIFSILVFMAIATTATVPFFLKWGVDWLRRRGELIRSDQRRGVLILGAGPTARALAEVLGRNAPATLLDRNPEHCLRARSEGLRVVQGNGLDEDTMGRAGAAHARHFIALTENADVNALAAQMARDVFLVPEIHVLSHGLPEGEHALLEHLGATTLFGGAVPLSDWDYRIDHVQAERAGVPISHRLTAEQHFRRLQRDRNSLPLALRRGDEYLPFHTGSTIESGDRLIVLHTPEMPASPLYDRFDRLAARCPVLDVDRVRTMDEFFALAAEALAPRLEMPSEALIERFHDRERSSSTVLLPGLAIPHVQIEGLERFEMLMARSRRGIRFPGQKERVHAAFVLVSSPDERNFHLRALSAIAKIVQWPDFERNWLMAPDAEALRSLVLRSTRRRLPELASDEPPALPAPELPV